MPSRRGNAATLRAWGTTVLTLCVPCAVSPDSRSLETKSPTSRWKTLANFEDLTRKKTVYSSTMPSFPFSGHVNPSVQSIPRPSQSRRTDRDDVSDTDPDSRLVASVGFVTNMMHSVWSWTWRWPLRILNRPRPPPDELLADDLNDESHSGASGAFFTERAPRNTRLATVAEIPPLPAPPQSPPPDSTPLSTPLPLYSPPHTPAPPYSFRQNRQ